jgi:predicted dehydrogenase
MAGRVFHGPLISSVHGLELAAVVERNSNNAAQRYPAITTCRSLDDMLADSSIDLFVVATPSGTHFQVASQILEAGRNVVVDKPMSTTSAEIAQLIQLAEARNVLLVPFHNRRWDSEFQTIQKLLHEGPLGRLVYLESRLDRWRPNRPSDRLWKEDPSLGGGVLLDLGTHLADQVLALFGLPDAVSADLLCEREWARAIDAFTLRLRYSGFTVVLGSNSLSAAPGPRFHLRGDKGSYWKWGLDGQEVALNRITRIADPVPGDYRLFYAGVRDALLGKSPAPVTALAAWRVARLFEWAEESSASRCEIPCDWSAEPR